MSVDITKRICYSETTSGAHIPSAAALRDIKWSTWCSPVGWPVKGLWDIQPNGAEPCAVQRSWGGMLFAAGNTSGRLFVVHNPCQGLAGFVGDNAHAGPISQIGWIAGDGTVVTTGSRDNSIMQWRCVYDMSRESGDEGGLSCEDSEVERDAGHEPFAVTLADAPVATTGQAMWMANISPPSIVRDDNNSVPSLSIQPEFIHGIRSGDCRQGIRYNTDGSLVFFSSRLGVIYDRSEHKQRIYECHKHAIISIDVGVNGKIVATGEIGINPDLHLWDAKTAAKLRILSNIHRNGITGVSFAPSGVWLATLGQDTLNSVVLLRSPSARWRSDTYVHSAVNVSPSKMLWIAHVDNLTNDYPIIVGGNKLIYFFRTVGKTLEKIRGTFGRKRKLQSVLCSTEAEVILSVGSVMASSNVTAGKEIDDSRATSNGRTIALITGTVTGHIYIWKNQRVVSSLTAHDAPIFALAPLSVQMGGGFVTGGKEGLVKTWGANMQMTYSYNLQTFTPTPFGLSVHSLRVNMTSSKLAIGIIYSSVYIHLIVIYVIFNLLSLFIMSVYCSNEKW
jgi:microtubule-associated protein-like 6